MILVVSTWVTPNGDAASGKPMPACTRARGDRDGLNRGLDVRRPPRTTPTLASKDAWTVGPARR